MVVYDASLAVMKLDQPIGQFYAPSTFVLGSRVLADRPPGSAVVDFDPQIITGGTAFQCVSLRAGIGQHTVAMRLHVRHSPSWES
jgi:hypothetical protein